MKVVELKPGDNVMGWMRLGYALRKAYIGATKQMYRYVPNKPTRFAKDDIQRFTGLVVRNDTVNKVLSLEFQEMNRLGTAVSQSIQADIPYFSLTRLRFLSKEATLGRPQNPLRPTAVASNTEFYPYRTLIEVELY